MVRVGTAEPEEVRWNRARTAQLCPSEVMDVPANHDDGSWRVTEAQSKAKLRLRRQRDTLRPLGWAVIAIVTVGTLTSRPTPGASGTSMGVTVALVLFVFALAAAITDRFVDRSIPVQLTVLAGMGAAGVTLTALQPHGATGLATGSAVWMAVARLSLSTGVSLAAAITVTQAAVLALAGDTSAALAATLLCGLLGVVAYFIRQARISQDRTEMLLAQLAEAQDEQEHAAALAERSRIASELHDVLAHSLSGAAIQLQGARLLADRELVAPSLAAAIERASQLVVNGLDNARHAIGALRGELLPTVSQLDALVDSFRCDMNLNATLSVQGNPRNLPADASLALYRGAQEALTNVVRYAPGATTSVVLHYYPNQTTLSVENSSPPVSSPTRLAHVGGGHGLTGLRERLERTGGSLEAGASDNGWRVQLVVPT
jgi:signal transduction histidine kinase